MRITRCSTVLTASNINRTLLHCIPTSKLEWAVRMAINKMMVHKIDQTCLSYLIKDQINKLRKAKMVLIQCLIDKLRIWMASMQANKHNQITFQEILIEELCFHMMSTIINKQITLLFKLNNRRWVQTTIISW